MTTVEVVWLADSTEIFEFDVPDDGKFHADQYDDEVRFTISDLEGGVLDRVSLNWRHIRYYRILDSARRESALA